jgi:hypothetical protein
MIQQNEMLKPERAKMTFNSVENKANFYEQVFFFSLMRRSCQIYETGRIYIT